jgi:eukaryotic-like serine/threonine-protein kinase
MTQIAGYNLGRMLGQGTFGETYEALKGSERVALKLIKEEAVQHGFDLRRFQREVRALQKAVGSNVVRLLDSGAAQLGNETRYFIVLEYLEGQDLAKAFKGAGYQFGELELKSILSQVLDGLKTVHDQNIVHRDLKPANIFLTSRGEIKLLDFGLVRMLDYTTLTTKPGQAIGTPQFIAPEILRGDAVDYRADFYSFGVLAYHLVTGGKFPFTGGTPLEIYARVVNSAPTSPTRHNRDLSSAFENIILSLLAKQPYERWLNHEELKKAIEETPLTTHQSTGGNTLPLPRVWTKRFFINLLHNEKSDIEDYTRSGGSLQGVIYPANFLPANRKTVELFHSAGIPFVIDPVTYRLAYSTFAQTLGLVKLPYVLDPNSILTPAVLQTLQVQQQYVKACLDWQLQWGPNSLLAPFHFARDLNSPWIDIDIKLLEESIAYRSSVSSDLPVYAGLCLNLEAYTVGANRDALLNRYSRARADGYYFLADAFDERVTNPLVIRAYLELLLLFKQMGKPIMAGRVGTLGLGFLAAGVDGASSGIASLASFSESTLLANRTKGYDMTKKYYMPGMMLTLPIEMAKDILSDSRNAALICSCPFCKGSPDNLELVSKQHFLSARMTEVEELNGLPDSAKRIEWFLGRISDAIGRCEAVRRQQIVTLQAGYYAHLKVWQQVLTQYV